MEKGELATGKLSKQPYFLNASLVVRLFVSVLFVSSVLSRVRLKSAPFTLQRHFYRFLPTIKSPCITWDEIGNGYCRNRNDYSPIKFEIVSIFLLVDKCETKTILFTISYALWLFLFSLLLFLSSSSSLNCSNVDSFMWIFVFASKSKAPDKIAIWHIRR